MFLGIEVQPVRGADNLTGIAYLTIAAIANPWRFLEVYE
jgi:hypothetical protein